MAHLGSSPVGGEKAVCQAPLKQQPTSGKHFRVLTGDVLSFW